MRLSRPMPCATSCTLAPACSHRSAISLMKVILVARKALAAYLISFGAAPLREHDRRVVGDQRAIQLAHHVLGAGVLGADHDAVGPHEVGDGRALAQELGVRHDGEVGIRAQLADDAGDLVAGADRHRRLGDDQLVAVEVGGDLARRLVDVAEVGEAVGGARGRADGDEDGVGCLGRRGELGGEGQPVCGHVAWPPARPRPGSKIGISPRFRAATLSGSLSMQVTTWPSSAKHAPVTRPT